MKPINTSTFDFPTLINERFVYVDKTRQIYELAKQGVDHVYFFLQLRRFGQVAPHLRRAEGREQGASYNPAGSVRTTDDIKCERADATQV